MKLLAIDTATEACSCALFIDGEIQQRSQIAPRQHTNLILPMADELLKAADLKANQLDGLAFGRGPGSFTGLRIASGVIQGIAFAADIPVAPISCLAALAQAAYIENSSEKVLAAIDARMDEVYFGSYIVDPEGIMRSHDTEIVCKPEFIKIPKDGKWYGVGSGWATELGNMLPSYDADKYPQAAAIIPLAVAAFKEGNVVNAEQALPVYLRNKVT
jgi:tRNA threonylcarbamoyladenosine biosynthesis protein TsaB